MIHQTEILSDGSKCTGKHPTPINIDTVDIVNRTYGPFAMTSFQDHPKNVELVNNGDTILFRLTYGINEPHISGGPLNGEFLLDYLYFHWMGNDTFDTANRTNAVFFPAELHMVFRNEKYATHFEAAREDNGIAILAYHYKVTKHDRFDYAGLMEVLQDLVKPGAVTKFRRPLKLWDLITYDIHDYYTYTGSLTTPLCSEEVTWIDFIEPVEISEKQVDQFRKIYAYDMTAMMYSYRPLFPLSNRTIFNALIMGDPDDEYMEYHSAVPFVDNLVGGAATRNPVEINIFVGLFSTLFIATWITTISQIMAKAEENVRVREL